MSRALGTDDSINTCDCCGRSGLKFTVAIELDSGEIVHYGQVCAARNTGKNQSTISAEIKAHNAAQVAAARAQWKSHPARLAERARFAERDRLPSDDARRHGKAAADFVREAANAAHAASEELAARFGVRGFEIRA